MTKNPVNRQNGKRGWVLAITSLAAFFIMLNVTIVNIAVPSIMHHFETNLSAMEWVINAYVLTFAVLLITTGRLSDFYGRKKFLIAGISIFTIASTLCAFAPSMELLIAARVLQALGGAIMMPSTMSLLTVAFQGKDRGLAFGIWGASVGVSTALGPTLGGLLVDTLSWRWIFLINIPMGILLFFLARAKLQESTDINATKKIDWGGIISISSTLFCLSFALIEGQSYGWDSIFILSLFGISILSFIAFIIIENKVESPLVDPHFFRNATFIAGNTGGLMFSFALITVIFLVALFLQLALGFSAIKAGLILMPMSITSLIFAPLSGRISDRIGGRIPAFLGFVIAAVGFYLLANLSATTDWQEMILPLAICGTGIGISMSPITSVVMSSAPTHLAGGASGILSAMRQVGSVFGISVIGAVFENLLNNNVADAINNLTIPVAAKEQLLEIAENGAMGGAPSHIPPDMTAYAPQLELLFKEQFAASVNTSLMVPVMLCIIAAFVCLVFIKERNPKKQIPA